MCQNGKIEYNCYLEDINRYKNDFERTIKDVYELISQEMQIKQFDARIKSYNSFCNNLYNNENKIKNLDDCFGIKIMIEDDEAIERVISKLQENGFNIKQIKDHKKKTHTNYNAVHVIANFKESTIPFEIQLRTPQRAEGRLAHDIYKMYGNKANITYNDKLKVVEEFIKLARLKMNGKYNELAREIPICYRIEDGNPVELEQKEIIRNLYPTAEEILGKKLFDKILNKLYKPGTNDDKELIPEKDRKMLEKLFDYIINRDKDKKVLTYI